MSAEIVDPEWSRIRLDLDSFVSNAYPQSLGQMLKSSRRYHQTKTSNIKGIFTRMWNPIC